MYLQIIFLQLEEVKEKGGRNIGLPSPLLSVIEEPSSESREQSIGGESTSIKSFQTEAIHYNTEASPSCSSNSNGRSTPSPPPCSRADKAPLTPVSISLPTPTTPQLPQATAGVEDTSSKVDNQQLSATGDSSSNTNSTETVVEQNADDVVRENNENLPLNEHKESSADASDEAIGFIQAALQAHSFRKKALSTINSSSEGQLTNIRNRIHVARPWQKKKPSLAPSLSLKEDIGAVEEDSSSASNLSEEERDTGLISSELLEHARRISIRAFQGVIKGHEVRSSALERLEADRDLFTSGKVSAMKAKFIERRRSSAIATAMAAAVGRSDGVTDDDDDVVY